jgi:hypothetical protein
MSNEILEQQINSEYKYGFVTDIETDTFAKGLNEEVVKALSKKKNEPEWLLEFRLKAFRYWLTLEEPKNWAHLSYPKINFQDISYYSAPKQMPQLNSLNEVDPELLKTFEKLGISLEEQIKDPNSLFNFYKKIISIKQSNIALAKGRYENVQNNADSVFSFYRKEENNTILVAVNLSASIQEFLYSDFKNSTIDILNPKQQLQKTNVMQPFQISIWKIE